MLPEPARLEEIIELPPVKVKGISPEVKAWDAIVPPLR